jgi:hypothetical protein
MNNATHKAFQHSDDHLLNMYFLHGSAQIMPKPMVAFALAQFLNHQNCGNFTHNTEGAPPQTQFLRG